MINALIIDDEPKVRKVLVIKLVENCPDINILDTAANVEEAYRKIILLKPQLLFLDITMPNGSGFKLLNRFDKVPFEVIFVTGYNEYALDALKVSAVDYLLKPVNTEDLVAAVHKASNRINNKKIAEQYEVLKHNLNYPRDQKAKIAVSSSDAFDIIRIADIIRCEGWNKYTKIHLVNGNTIISSNNIGSFKDKLLPYNFYASHKSHIINLKLISRYLKEGLIIMTDGSEVPLARRRREDFTQNMLGSILSQ